MIGRTVRVKNGPYGPYVELEAADDGDKPKRVSIPDGVEATDVDLPYAVPGASTDRGRGPDDR